MTEPQRPAVRCANPHPLCPELLCERLSGHGGTHGADDGSNWIDDWTTGGNQ